MVNRCVSWGQEENGPTWGEARHRGFDARPDLAGSGWLGRRTALARLLGEWCWAIVPSEGRDAPPEARVRREPPSPSPASRADDGPQAQGDRFAGVAFLLLRQAVRHAVAQGSYFERAAGRPGFAPAIGDLIREFKQGEVTIDAFLDAASACAAEVDDPCFLEKCECIAAIWREYDRLLSRHETRDADDLLAQAMAAVDGWRGGPERIVVDGFTSFTPQQIGLLAGLQRRGIHLEICLTYDPRGLSSSLAFRAPGELRPPGAGGRGDDGGARPAPEDGVAAPPG